MNYPVTWGNAGLWQACNFFELMKECIFVLKYNAHSLFKWWSLFSIFFVWANDRELYPYYPMSNNYWCFICSCQCVVVEKKWKSTYFVYKEPIETKISIIKNFEKLVLIQVKSSRCWWYKPILMCKVILMEVHIS